MSEQEFNSKSPAWHMAQIRAAIRACRARGDLVEQEKRRKAGAEYWRSLQEATGGRISYTGVGV